MSLKSKLVRPSLIVTLAVLYGVAVSAMWYAGRHHHQRGDGGRVLFFMFAALLHPIQAWYTVRKDILGQNFPRPFRLVYVLGLPQFAMLTYVVFHGLRSPVAFFICCIFYLSVYFLLLITIGSHLRSMGRGEARVESRADVE